MADVARWIGADRDENAARDALLRGRIIELGHIIDRVDGDTLVLTLDTGKVVTISANRLYLRVELTS